MSTVSYILEPKYRSTRQSVQDEHYGLYDTFRTYSYGNGMRTFEPIEQKRYRMYDNGSYSSIPVEDVFLESQDLNQWRGLNPFIIADVLYIMFHVCVTMPRETTRSTRRLAAGEQRPARE